MRGGMSQGQHGWSVAGYSDDLEQSVQNINNRAFFRKAEGWVDGTLTAEQQKAENMITVKQFSDEYFKLIEKHGKALSQYLVFDEAVLVNFDGKAYNFVP